ncbi:unnamed protein product [Urochloa humidicola]
MDRDGSRAAGGDGPPVAAAGPTLPSRPPPSPGIEALAAEALVFNGESNEEARTLILILEMCSQPYLEIMETELNLILLHLPLQSIDVDVQKALECPCLDDLKRGPCGSQFIDAFSCYLKSTKEEKGSDCVDPFIALQNCIRENKEAFIKEILEEEENDEKAEKSNIKVLPPAWSREPKPKTRGHSK